MGIKDRLFIATMTGDAVKTAREFGLGIEIDEFSTASHMDGENFFFFNNKVFEIMKYTDRFIFHAPFNELFPCAVDPLARELAAKRYEQAYKISASYGINRMVVHSGYVPIVYYNNWFISQTVLFWKEFLEDKPTDFNILIENVLEPEPYILLKLIDEIMDSRVMLCLDLGHAYFNSVLSISEWISALGPVTGHVHLHNNDRLSDGHYSLGKGGIDIKSAILRISDILPEATFSIESHRSVESVNWLCENGLF